MYLIELNIYIRLQKKKNKKINPIYENHFKVFSKKISSLRGSNV